MRINFLCFFLLVLTAHQTFGGGIVGNGGDVIECQASPDNFLKGLYSLDYVATLQSAQNEDAMIAVQSWEQSIARIENLLQEKVPSLAISLKKFRENIFNHKPGLPYIWETAPFGLIDLTDEKLTTLIPQNCLRNGKPQLIQSIIKQSPIFSGTGIVTIFKYNLDLIERLKKEAPAQLSFLILHEWLWEISFNVDRNRRMNRFFHSNDFEQMSSTDVIAYLNHIGYFPPETPLPAFDQQSCQGDPLKQNDINERFPGLKIGRWFGKGNIFSRSKPLKCSTPQICQENWSEAYHPAHDNPDSFFFTEFEIGKTASTVNLYLKRSEQNVPTRVLKCHLVDDPKMNLRCDVINKTSLYQFGGQSTEPLQGFVNWNCMHIEAFSQFTVDLAGDVDGEDIHILQNVVFFQR